MNLLPNSRTDKSTPSELTTNPKTIFHADIPFLPFGATAMVLQDNSKRSRIAKARLYPKSSTPKAELGVCMGTDIRYPGSYLFRLSNGLVVPRRVITVVNTIPFDWNPQSVVSTSLLANHTPAEPLLNDPSLTADIVNKLAQGEQPEVVRSVSPPVIETSPTITPSLLPDYPSQHALIQAGSTSFTAILMRLTR